MKNLFFLFALPVALLMSCGGQTDEQNTAPDDVATPVTGDVQTTSPTPPQSLVMYSPLNQYIETAKSGMEAIPEARKNQLKKIALFVKTKRQSGEPVNLNFICTHNSRRSHMGQLWAATAAHYYGIEGVNTFSGGTEATAFNPRAVAAMQRAGLQVNNPGGENPRYEVRFAEGGPAMTCFSKKYDDPENPKENFAAVMTCSEADKNCPIIPGASLRVPIPYEDPKEADGTDEETARYDERCKQIATEMLYLMSEVAKAV